MIYAVFGLAVIMTVALLITLNQEVKRLQTANDTLQKRLMAMTNVEAVSVSDLAETPPPGKVTYVDEQREVELDEARS